jgi:hypothetical protein
MAKEDDKGTEVEETDEDTPELDENEKGDGEEEDSDDDKESKPSPELTKAIKRRDAALARARKAEAALAAATKKDGEDDKPDPVAVANERLVKASARTVLAGIGVTDKEDQRTILAVLNLSDVEVDDEDGPDEDAIEERISDLRRILGGKEPVKQTRVPKSTSSKDKGSSGSTADPDAARYRAFMAGKR